MVFKVNGKDFGLYDTISEILHWKETYIKKGFCGCQKYYFRTFWSCVNINERFQNICANVVTRNPLKTHKRQHCCIHSIVS